MRWLLITLMSFPLITGLTQPSGKRIQPMVAAEESFIRMAKEQNTRDAFLHFLADDAITSPPGQGPVRGKQHLKERQPDESWLSWKPVFSDIALSGDFGYNTGPWEFRNRRTDQDPVAHGQFVSVWKKNARGEWSVALDMGISHGPHTIIRKPETSKMKTQTSASDLEELFEIERKLIDDLLQRDGYTYDHLLSEEAKFFRPGLEPIHSEEINDLLTKPSEFIYTFESGDIADSGDMGYVYGKIAMQTTGSIHGYLRIWKKENDQWKIVVDLVSD